MEESYEIRDIKKNHLKRNILIAIGVVLILSAIILTFTRAKYRTTQSMPLLQGTINFSPYDFNVVAIYLNKGDETITTKKAPHVGYTLNSEQSSCVVDEAEVDNGQILFENGNLTFQNMNYSGTKCSVYFDLMPDSEKPMINNIVKSSTTDTELTITVNASDNIGVYYYYYQLDTGEEIRSEDPTYTFEELVEDQIYTLTIRVEDAAGNISDEYTEDVTAGIKAKDIILAQEGGAATIEAKETPNFASVATTDEGMYAAEDDWGTSYYYRGAVNDNWIKFETNSSGQELYWRIIRINGDGTIRLIYEGTSTRDNSTSSSTTQIGTSAFNSSRTNNMYVGYMYQSGQVHGLTSNSTIKGTLDTWYQNNLADEAEYIEGSTGFCGDRTPYSGSGIGTTQTYYAAYNRLDTNKSPKLTCTDGSDLYTTSGSGQGNQALTNPIGLITADEVAMAGGTGSSANQSYYLYTGQYYWTMSPCSHNSSHGTNMYIMYSGSYLGGYYVDIAIGVRPVINLKDDVQVSGTGTTTDPYIVVTHT